MQNRIDVMRRKLLGTVSSIEKMEAQERKEMPSGVLGQDYNMIRATVAEEIEAIAPYLPPEALLDEYAVGPRTVQSFGEIHIYCSQLLELLAAQSDEEAP